MISEEDKARYAECVNCTTCQEWHHHCNAECCKLVWLDIDPRKMDEGVKYLTIKPNRHLSVDEIRYHKYREIEYVRGMLRLRKDRIYIIGHKIVYLFPCSQLENNLCKLHGKNKPKICESLTLESAKVHNDSFIVTDNCLFKYKAKEVIKHGED